MGMISGWVRSHLLILLFCALILMQFATVVVIERGNQQISRLHYAVAYACGEHQNNPCYVKGLDDKLGVEIMNSTDLAREIRLQMRLGN